jgi:class 3 adenylate cyclase
MTAAPGTHYTRSVDGTNLAYQVSGEGPIDLVWMHGTAVPIDLMWDNPGFSRMGQRVGRFSRTIWPEHRGIGASGGDPVQTTRGDYFVQDLTAVLDDVGCERVVVVAASTFGQNAITFASAHPERVAALVLANTFAYYMRDDDCPFGVPPEKFEGFADQAEQWWGTEANLVVLAPSQAGDERFCEWWRRCCRLGISPRQLTELHQADFRRDVRPLLASLDVRTLVLHRQGDRYIRADSGRYLAEHIPTAKFVLLPGDDHLLFAGDTDGVVNEIEEFLTGHRQAPEGDVVLAAILFTDIVASTEHQARVGQREWSRLTDHHDAMIRAALSRHRGDEIKTMGDGFLATFDATGRALRCAADILAGAKDIGLDLRAGVHTGEVEVRGDDIAGLAVTIAKRLCDLAAPGQVMVSDTVRGHMVGSRIEFTDQGEHHLKGVPGTWRLFSLKG